MNENSNQHYTIHDLSAISAFSNTLGSMTNEEMKKDLLNRKKSIEAQKKIVKNLKSEFINNSNSNIDINFDLLKTNTNEKILQLNEELSNSKEKIKNLSKENKSLKKIIDDKDKLISEFEEVVLKSKEKFNKLQKINNALKEEVIILKNNGGINYKMNTKEIKNMNLDQKRENINKKFNHIQIEVNNSVNKSVNKTMNENENENEIDSINNNNEEGEKDKLIVKLNNELVYIYSESIHLSNIM